MKQFSQLLWFVCIVFFIGCATAPQAQDKQTKADTSRETPGVYKNEEFRFTMDYPEHWKYRKTMLPTELIRVTNTTNYNYPIITINTWDVTTAPNMLDPKAFTKNSMEVSWPGTKRFKVIEEEDITLNDGTPAKSFSYKWTWSDGVSKLITVALITEKNGKYIGTTSTGYTPGGTPLEDLYILVRDKFKFY